MRTRALADTWISRFEPRPRARVRLFCFPYAGGAASLFWSWAAQLPEAIELCPVQLPGRENRFKEAPYTRVGQLVEVLARALAPSLDRPFAFFGHSMGALICFELARQLRRERLAQPAQLFVAGFRAPHLPNRMLPIHHLPDGLFIEQLRQLNGTPEEVLQDVELRTLLLPLLRADFALCENYAYIPEVPLTCPIVAFGGLRDKEATLDELAGWAWHTSSAFALEPLPGDHFFLVSARERLVQSITTSLSWLLTMTSQ